MKTIYIATGNSKKLKIISEILQDLDVQIEGVSLDLNEHQVIDMEAISKDKAGQAFEILHAPVIVDDSGMYFEKYHEFPGVYTKPVYEGLGFEGLKRLIDEGDAAYFQTVISYMDEDLDEPITFKGVWQGRLSKNNTDIPEHDEMPYNYLFIPKGSEMFVSEMSAQEGEVTSQRAQAVHAFKEWHSTHRA
jgi:non-canonical purine NTP pyrophosphatase (RdgB/HAM1 family)